MESQPGAELSDKVQSESPKVARPAKWIHLVLAGALVFSIISLVAQMFLTGRWLELLQPCLLQFIVAVHLVWIWSTER